MNWEIGIDMYTLMCMTWMTNKDLLYKKINKIKFKKIIIIKFPIKWLSSQNVPFSCDIFIN